MSSTRTISVASRIPPLSSSLNRLSCLSLSRFCSRCLQSVRSVPSAMAAGLLLAVTQTRYICAHVSYVNHRAHAIRHSTSLRSCVHSTFIRPLRRLSSRRCSRLYLTTRSRSTLRLIFRHARPLRRSSRRPTRPPVQRQTFRSSRRSTTSS